MQTFLTRKYFLHLLVSLCLLSVLPTCKKKESSPPSDISLSFTVDGVNNGTVNYKRVNTKPVVKFRFSESIEPSTVSAGFQFKNAAGSIVAVNRTLSDENKVLQLSPVVSLAAFTSYQLSVTSALRSSSGGKLTNPVTINLLIGIDSSDKFPRISDSALLDLVQRQTFKYFWDFAHPVSGLARERNTSGDVVTSGGSGFGIMSIIVAAKRNFINHADALARLQKIVSFLKNNAQKFHGVFPHWLNGSSGAVIPFSQKDDGADLVETAYLMQGLLAARQYFNASNTAETNLRSDINSLWNGVEWSWFRKSNENVLYWHWSPNYAWDMNHQIKGWNEALITYALAASSTTYTIPKVVYDAGWATSSTFLNGNAYYGIPLPLGPAIGGPLFFAHYSFLGINPKSLADAYANYETQNTAHSLINYNYCRLNPKGFYGYSDSCWGLTASDDINGYLAHEPKNDDGVISPTAALSSMPHTPAQSMAALRFFYYKLGDKTWKQYGFIDAFSLDAPWFADSFLAIDQGPIIVMLENYRSGLLWNLFMSCPEVKAGMLKLGFTSPHL